MNKYKLQSKYKATYQMLENALEVWADDHNLNGYRFKTDSGSWKYNAIANHVLDFCRITFNYVDGEHQKIIDFLQGLGLSVDFYYQDIYQLAYKDGRLKKSDSEKKHFNVTENYWSLLAMRLKNIASSKN